MKTNLLGHNIPALVQFLQENGEKPFRAKQILQWIHANQISDFHQMTNLSKELRQKLEDIAQIQELKVISENRAKDGTRKWLFEVENGGAIETVYIPEPNRATLCISSQVGCSLNCSFCYTAQQGFARNLTSAEIIGQLWHVVKQLKQEGVLKGERVITNVVMMGMGEPLLNFDNVICAIEIMLDDLAYGLSKRRVTLSTSGVIPGIDKLREVSDIALAVSLHAPNDELRNELVPLNKKYPIRELLAACKRYLGKDSRRRITMEYVMLDGVNDFPAHAYELSRILRDVPSKVNLIPHNYFQGTKYRRSSDKAISQFQAILVQQGIATFTRKTRGDDIEAACGQLAGQVKDRTKRSERFKLQVINTNQALIN